MVPLKALSLPRLELSAALLLALLIEKTSSAIDLTDTPIFLWSDSTIVLNWISSPSRKWSVFVANRVGEIQRRTDVAQWHHIASADNPADVLSRGIGPLNLANATTWWHGPEFLLKLEYCWPNRDFTKMEEELPEQRTRSVALVMVEHSAVDQLLSKYSNLL